MYNWINLAITLATILISVGIAYGIITEQSVAIKNLSNDIKNSHSTTMQEIKEIRKEINQHNHNFYKLEIQTLNKLHEIELQQKKQP
jgi:predicted PurR-regulated permease PerM